MKTTIQIVLIALAIFLGYQIFRTIEDPIEFKKERKAREEVTISKLKDIRKAELAFKNENEHFTGDWDSLITFVKEDSLSLVRKIGMLTDSMIDAGWTEKTALKKGRIIRDTLHVSVLDSVFGKDYPIDKLKYIPVKDTVAVFQLGVNIIKTGSGIVVPVFEAKAHNNIVLRGMNRQMIINLNEESRINNKYPGLKVGSLEEVNNNAGNWE